MKNLLVFATFLLISCFQAVGQQMEFSPANSVESVLIESLEESGPDFMGAGYKGGGLADQALVVKTSSAGLHLWSRIFEEGASASSFNASTTLDGDIVPVGYSGINALITRVTPSGSGVVSWAKSLSAADSVLAFRDVQTTPSGDIIAVGMVRPSNSTIQREMIVLMSGNGNVLWATALSDGGGTRRADKVILKGDSVCVFGTGQGNAKDVSLSIFRLSDGLLLNHFLYGSFDHDVFLDAVACPGGGFYFSFFSGSYTNPIIVRLNQNLNLIGDPVVIFPLIEGGVLSIDANQLVISGSMNEIDYKGSFALSMSHSLSSLNWAKGITPGDTYSSAPAPSNSFSKVLWNGNLVFVDAKDGLTMANVRGSVATTLTSSGTITGSSYCNEPLNILNLFYTSNFPVITPVTQARTQVAMNISVGSVGYESYTPVVTSCAPVLLPVELISFIGEKQGETSVLRWQTASEHQTSHFKVFRSKDMEDWKEIGTVDAAGESQQLLDYRFVDENPLTGDNFYRLETVDIDDSTEYSDVVVVSFDFSRENFVVYPNPAKAGEWVTVKGEFQTVEAYDQTGRQVPFQRNGNQLALQEAGLGVYLLTFVDANGVPQTVRIVMN